jgi:putative hydrolase of the HAD superfamily
MAIRMVLFDLDNTLYPASSGLMQSLDQRIGEFVQRSLGLSEEESLRLRRQYYAEFGTTLRGLRHHNYQVETEHYLEYVHDVALDAFLASDEKLELLLGRLAVRKAIFTNSPREYALRVLQTLGIEHHFERVFDARFFDFVCKPDPSCYQRVLAEIELEGRDVLLIEDTAANLPPAARVGMTTILIDEQARSTELADYVVHDVHAAIEIAIQLAAPVDQSAQSSAPTS